MNKIISYFLILFFIGLYSYSKSQNIGLGASAMYNIQSESFAGGIRGNFFPNKRFSIAPQFSYYFGPKIKEFTLGLGLEGKFIKKKKLTVYGLLHGGYNRWISYSESGLKNAQPVNWNLEGGVGITNSKCLRPFLEYRYNLKFKETHLNLGFLYIFGCKKDKYLQGDRCPTFN